MASPLGLPAPRRRLRSAAPLDAIDRAILENGYIVNNAPRFFLVPPRRLGWCAWEWAVQYGEATVAEGRAWSERAAFRRRWAAYLAADETFAADRAGLRDRGAGVPRTDGPAT
jgi:hypothetical protein